MSWRILVGDVLDQLLALPDESVHCCVTSPPYWGLRDYGVDGQIGLEATPEEYTAKIVEVFRGVWRVLRPDGTLWVNIGDSYAGSWGAQSRGSFTPGTLDDVSEKYSLSARQIAAHPKGQTGTGSLKNTPGLKAKDLVGIPWRIAFALQADGWWLRQDLIWSKPNPMPESVRDRCTKAHEYIFLLAKSERYYYDADAIKERVSGTAHARGDGVNPKAREKTPAGWDTSAGTGAHGAFHRIGREGPNSRMHQDRDPSHPSVRKPRAKQNESFSAAVTDLVEHRNKRSVWEIATEAFPEAHFATFPTELVLPCILAGCPAGGTVLDPFSGAGTTGLVATRHGRNYIGIELNRDYAAMRARRIKGDAPLFNEPEQIVNAPAQEVLL